jgi:alanine racemase
VARVHLKVDTGMGRWGVRLEDAIDCLDRLLAIDGVEVEGVMTHFATADDLDDDGFFDLQLQRFTELVAQARERVPGIVAHAANSAATLRSDAAHFDAVRCGVATYGLDPVLSLRSHVAMVRDLQPGESTGYGRSFIATEPTRIARVPIGYADGVRRALANRGHALVHGVARDIVGNVSMDHISLRVDEGVSVGDVVTLIGRDAGAWVGADPHAQWADTINSAVTCGIAGEPRLLRAHVQGG